MSVSVDQVVDQGQVRLRPGASRRELVECLPVLRESLECERAFRVDRLTRLTAEARDGARDALADIERALAAIRAGTYGSCADCAAEIPLAVLRSVPQAKRCLRCHRLHPRVPTVDQESPVDPAEGGTPAQPVVWVRRLLGRPVLGPAQQHLGHVRDVVARRLPDAVGTVVTGLIADAGGHRWFAPATAIRDLDAGRIELREFAIRPAGCRFSTEQLLVQDSLGRPVLTAPDEPPARITDIALRRAPAGWTVWAADTRTTAGRLLGSPRGLVAWDAFALRRLATPIASPADI